MKDITKKTLSTISTIAVILSSFAIISFAAPVSAATVTMIGNDTTARTQVDANSNFTIVDTNHPATSAGQITSFGYYASNLNPFNFVLVDGSNVVQWISPTITPTAVGVNTYTPTSPVSIQTGWNVGLYFSSTGTIPFESTGATASYTAAASGIPTTGVALSVAGSSARTYSFAAYGTPTPVLTTVTVSPTTETLNIGGTQQLTASPWDQSSNAFVGATLGYASNNTPVATVSSSGLITAVSAGTATITVTATSGTTVVTTTSAVTVNAATPVLTSVTVSPTTETLSVGGTQQLTPNPLDQNLVTFPGAVITYGSSNTAVATVSSSGLITAVSAGPATITVTATSGTTVVTATSTVTVSAATPVLTTVTVTPTAENLNIGGTQQLTPNPLDQNSLAFVGATISYASSNTAVATVSTTGLVTAVSAGTATITVSATSGTTVVTTTSAVTVNSTPTGTAVIGNDTTARTQLDLASNFTVVDTNHPATGAGQINSFGYYASNLNPFSFVLVNGSSVVQWVSPLITPTAVGMNTYTPTFPLAIQTGWNLGVYFSSTGTIPYEITGATGSWTNVGTGVPAATETLSFLSSGPRTYSFVAYGTMTTVTTPILTTVTVSPTTETLSVGGTQQLTASPMDQNSIAFVGATVSYASSNTAVATVDPSTGLITAVSAGTATITVTATSGTTVVTTTSAVTVSATVTPPSTVTPYLPAPIATPNIDFYVGNDALTVRTQVDTYSNFTVVDTNSPASEAGYIPEINYYAANMNPFEFVFVNSSNTVEWISPTITPSVIGFNDYEPTTPVAIQAGWNLGAHFDSTGTIPFEYVGASASWTANNSGMPTTGTALTVAGSGDRMYSFVAAGIVNLNSAKTMKGRKFHITRKVSGQYNAGTFGMNGNMNAYTTNLVGTTSSSNSNPVVNTNGNGNASSHNSNRGGRGRNRNR